MREVAEPSLRGADEQLTDAEILSPMPGSVIAVHVAPGAEVAAGAPVVVVEAMKMEHTLTAPVAGKVELLVAAGDQVQVEQVLARITAEPTVDDTTGSEQKEVTP